MPRNDLAILGERSMKRTIRTLLVVLVVGTVLVSVGTTAVVADKPKHSPQSNHCQNYKGGDEPHAGPNSGPNCPGSQKGGSMMPFLILAPLGLKGRSLESLLD
jgi:hypothetical protein